MIQSMTGFARRETRYDWGTISCEIRSVNHRYLEVSWRLPDELRPLEPALRKVVSGQLKRGKIECGLRLRWSEAVQPPIRLNTAVLEQLSEALRTASGFLPQAAAVDPLDILRWPRVVEDVERDTGPLEAAALAILDESLAELTASRSREGEHLASLVGEARTRLPEVRQALRDRTLERIGQLDVQPDSDRVEQELVLLAQKMDVDEELDRLGAHVAEVRRALESEQAVGRRLDFLMQEFNREANTLASKSQDQESTRIAVELKVLIEQMREQVQNVE
jgi:uncharacterized protein (TIGR00255 family)